VAVLLLACWKLLHALEQGLDLAMWDEAQYLRSGRELASGGAMPDPEWGPLYSLWYSGLSRLWPDPVALYYANSRLLIVLTAVGAYACARRMGARPALSLLGASIYLLSDAPHIIPRPTLLALLILLAVVFVASFIEAPEGFWALVGVGGLVASFARPEFFVVFLLVTALLAFLLGRKVLREGRTALPRGALLVAGVGLSALLLIQAMGNPFGNTSNRRFYAFCQHFALGYVQRTQSPVEPWGDCDQVIESVFGKVDTFGAAARSNPGAFLEHLWHNAKGYVVNSVRLFFEGPGRASPVRGAWTVERMGRLLLLAAVVWQVARLLLRWRRVPAAMAEPRLQRLGGVLLAVELPTVLSALLVYPRDHYLVIQGVLVAAFLAVLGSRLAATTETRLAGRVPGVALALGLLVLTPDLSRRSSEPRLEHLRVVRAIQSLGLTERLEPGESVHLLEAQGGYDAYLGNRYCWVRHGHKKEPFREFLRKRDVELIILDDKLRKDRRFVNDAEFLSFESNPESFGFSTTPLPGQRRSLAFPRAWVASLHPQTQTSSTKGNQNTNTQQQNKSQPTNRNKIKDKQHEPIQNTIRYREM